MGGGGGVKKVQNLVYVENGCPLMIDCFKKTKTFAMVGLNNEIDDLLLTPGPCIVLFQTALMMKIF